MLKNFAKILKQFLSLLTSQRPELHLGKGVPRIQTKESKDYRTVDNKKGTTSLCDIVTENMPKKPHNYQESEFVRAVRLNQQHYDFVKLNRGKRSAAGFAKVIFDEYIKNHSELKTE